MALFYAFFTQEGMYSTEKFLYVEVTSLQFPVSREIGKLQEHNCPF